MKLLLMFVIVCTSITLHAQTLSKYPVRRAYSYSDNTGKYKLELSESIDSIEQDDTLHYNIQAVCYTDGLAKKWEMNDHCIRKDYETSIWFWTKFITVDDIDKDGIADPVLVYGTIGSNGTDDGRVKILIYYKGVKTAIRHQNAILDGERITDIDASFYSLPQPLQKHVRKLLATLNEKGFTIYADNFEAKMNKKMTHIQ